MRRALAAHPEIVRRSNQPLAEMMLPDAIDDHACEQGTGPVFGVRDPRGQGTALVGRVGPIAGSTSFLPVVGRRLSAREYAQKAQLDRNGSIVKVATPEEPARRRLRPQVPERH